MAAVIWSKSLAYASRRKAAIDSHAATANTVKAIDPQGS
jgi:hypothetical protein